MSAPTLTDRRFLPTDEPSFAGSEVAQVIVTTSDLAAEFELLAARETKRGIPTAVRTVSWIEAHYQGIDRADRIRRFLQDAQRMWGTEYAVLGADAEAIPPRYVPWNDEEIATDLYYECLDRDWNEDGDAIFAEPLTAGALDGWVNDIAVAPDGRTWVATHFGVSVWDAGEFVATWDASNGLATDAVFGVDVAADGTVWIGISGGVARYDGNTWTTWSLQSFGVDRGSAVLALSASEAWVGTNLGAAHFSGGNWTHTEPSDGLPLTQVTDLAHFSGDVWFATPAGLGRYDGVQYTMLGTADGLHSNWTESLAISPTGDLWVGHADNFFTNGGFSVFDGVAWTTDPLTTWNDLSIRSIAFGPAAGEVWAATPVGIFHRTTSGDELLDSVAGLPTTESNAIARTPAGVQVGTAGGLAVETAGQWTNFGPEDGLPIAPIDYDDIDLRPDLIVGRIPASNPSEVAIYRQKVIDYQDGAASDHGDRLLLLGENLFSPGDGKGLCLAARAEFPAEMQVTEQYEVDGNQDAASAAAALSQGPGWVVHVGHGSYDAMGVGPGLELLFNGHLDGVDAAGRSAYLVVYSCNSGGFDFESSAEHLLFNPNGGGIAVTANTREAVPDVDAYLNEAMFAEIFASPHAEPARAMHAVRAAELEDHENDYRLEHWWRRMYISRSFCGLPTLALWRAQPETLAVAHAATLPAGRAPFTVTVTDDQTALPLEGALVCVAKGNEDYAYGRTDSNGVVTFDFRPEGAGLVEVTVSAADYLPYLGSATVLAPTGENLVADGWQVSSSRGKSGSEMEFLLAVRNAGGLTANGGPVQLVSEDLEVLVTSGSATLAPVAVGGTTWVGPFRVLLNPSVPYGGLFDVRLEGTGGTPFSETYQLTARSMDFAWEGVVLSGDEIRPILRNVGSEISGTLSATIEAIGGGGSVVQASATSAALIAGDSRTFDEPLRVAGPASASFRVTVSDPSGRSVARDFDRLPPADVTGLRAEPLDGAVRLVWDATPDSDAYGYRIFRRGDDGRWQNELGEVHRGMAAVEVPVAPGGSREFAVVAVDAALCESANYATVLAHAAPPHLPGWPRKLVSLLGPTSVTASDLDGNGSLEVVLGSMWEINAVNVYREDGTEWTDADQDPATDGVFGTTNDRIHAAVLARDLDGDGHQEIFAASLDGTVYGWSSNSLDASGTPVPLPGWPIFHTVRGVRASPVAGDVDGDGDLEIVTVANDGFARAFELDGTLLPGWPAGQGRPGAGSTPAIFDFDGNGTDEVVFGGTDSLLYVFQGDGTNFPGFPRQLTAKVLAAPVLADVEGDATPEIFVPTRDGKVWGMRSDASDLPGWPVSVDPYTYVPPSPAVADLDSDGVPEILVPGGTKVFALNADGSPHAGFPLELGEDAITSPVVADLDGDGSLDILQASTDRTLHALRLDGSALPGWPRTFREMPSSTPFVADIDGDGDLDVALGADDLFIRVLDVPGSDRPGAAPWPGYHGGANLDGLYVPPSQLTPTDVSVGLPPLAAVELYPAAPNPFRAATDLRFALPQRAPVSVEVFDVTGRRVATPLTRQILPAGAHEVRWDGRDHTGRPVATGVYFVRLVAPEQVRSSKVLRVR